MTAGKVKLFADAGSGYAVVFTYCNPVTSAPGVPGPPIDVTGWYAAMSVRSSYGDGAAISLDSEELGGIVVGTTDGSFTVSMTADQTLQLPSLGVWDLLVTPPMNEPIRIAQGQIETAPFATNPNLVP